MVVDVTLINRVTGTVIPTAEPRDYTGTSSVALRGINAARVHDSSIIVFGLAH